MGWCPAGGRLARRGARSPPAAQDALRAAGAGRARASAHPASDSCAATAAAHNPHRAAALGGAPQAGPGRHTAALGCLGGIGFARAKPATTAARAHAGRAAACAERARAAGFAAAGATNRTLAGIERRCAARAAPGGTGATRRAADWCIGNPPGAPRAGGRRADPDRHD